MKDITEYMNTDFDLESKTSFDVLHLELDNAGCVLHYANSEGNWHLTLETADDDGLDRRSAEQDILSIIGILARLSPEAKSELSACHLREFNIGFCCGDTWAYTHSLPNSVVQAIAATDCSIAVTLYPTHDTNKTPIA